MMNQSLHTLCIAVALVFSTAQVQAFCSGDGDNYMDQQCRQRVPFLDPKGQEALDEKKALKQAQRQAEIERQEDRKLDQLLRVDKHIVQMKTSQVQTVVSGVAAINQSEKPNAPVFVGKIHTERNSVAIDDVVASKEITYKKGSENTTTVIGDGGGSVVAGDCKNTTVGCNNNVGDITNVGDGNAIAEGGNSNANVGGDGNAVGRGSITASKGGSVNVTTNVAAPSNEEK